MWGAGTSRLNNEERVSYLEGKVEEHSRGIGGVGGLIGRLDEKLDRRFEALEQKVDGCFGALDQKVDRFREELAGQIRALDQKFSRHFLWLAGFQLTTLLAVVGALTR